MKDFSTVGIKIWVTTSKTRPRAESILRNQFADLKFDTLISSELVHSGHRRPYPDQRLQSELNLSISHGDSIYVADMDMELMASDAAIFFFVHTD